MQFYLFSTVLIGTLAALALRAGALGAEFIFCSSAAAAIGLVCMLRQTKRLSAEVERGALIILSASAGLRLASIVFKNAVRPPEWDFLCYWAYSLASSFNMPLYETKFSLAQSLPMVPSAEFVTELLGTPFHFPPPAAFLYSWLVAFDFQTAALVWCLLMFAALLASGWLLTEMFSDNSHSSLLPLTLLLCLGPSAETFAYCQTNFLLLLCVSIYMLNVRSFAGGALIGFAAVTIKPIAALFLLFALMKRYYTPLFGAACMVTVMLVLSSMSYGWSNVLAYFVSDLPSALPSNMYVQEINQSLLSASLRLTSYDYVNLSPLFSPAFLGAAFLLTGITLLFAATCSKQHETRALLSVIILALLCYPGTLTHYSVLLIVPLLYSISKNEKFAPYILVSVLVLTSIDSWKTGTFTLLLCWGWSIIPFAQMALGHLLGERAERKTSAVLGLN